MLDDLTQPGPVPPLQPIRFLEDPDAARPMTWTRAP